MIGLDKFYFEMIILNSGHTSVSMDPSWFRPDMTFAVDWALSNNYLSIQPGTAHSTKKGLEKDLPSLHKDLFFMEHLLFMLLIDLVN